jgi:5-methylcytosine-specific restriction endonuclease McrA
LTDARRLEEGEAAFRQLHKNYKYTARRRGLQFNLTRSEFRVLTEQNCHYCGSVPSQVYGATHTGINGAYTYNGVDRVNNELGYEPDNCVPCCKACNSAKGTMPYEEFMAYLDRLVTFRSRGE